MNPETQQLRQSIAAQERDINGMKDRLAAIERNCQHDWDVRYKPERQEGYTIPGDPPGTMGVDWRGPVYVPPKTIERWERTCKKCGKVETTTKTNASVTVTPSF